VLTSRKNEKGRGMPLHRHTTTIDVGRSDFRLIRLPNPCYNIHRLWPTKKISQMVRVERTRTIGTSFLNQRSVEGLG
jgi:hypothetical protein